jgi:hypothetical protein
MQDKEAYINSIVESLQMNPSYTRHFDFKGKNALMFLDLSNILCRAHDYSLWIDIEDLVLIFSTLFSLKGHYAYTSTNLSTGMIKFLYDTGFVVFQSPFDSDAIMGYTICSIAGEAEVDLVIIGTHDGGFRGISDQLAQRGVPVAFLGFREMFSSFLRSSLLFCFEDMDVLSSFRETQKPSTDLDINNLKSQIRSE